MAYRGSLRYVQAASIAPPGPKKDRRPARLASGYLGGDHYDAGSCHGKNDGKVMALSEGQSSYAGRFQEPIRARKPNESKCIRH